MNYEQITTAAETFMSHPGFDQLTPLYRDGMREGFKDGARWAQKEIETQTELLENTKAAFEKLLRQVETLQTDIEQLKRPKSQAYPK
jgi:TRAP-type C4-dicarboxylate transport system substrate-binding protein